MHATLQLIKRATNSSQESDKYLQLVQKRYKKDYGQRVRFVPSSGLVITKFWAGLTSSTRLRTVTPLNGMEIYYHEDMELIR